MSFTNNALRFFIFKKYKISTLFNVSFTVHSSLVVAVFLLPLSIFSEDTSILINFFLCHVLMLLCHELGHAVFCKINGLRVHEVHIGIIHGLCSHEYPACGDEYKNTYVAWGGVSAQACLAIIAVKLEGHAL